MASKALIHSAVSLIAAEWKSSTGCPRLAKLELSVQENNQLVEWTRRHKTSQALALRSRIILACAQGASNREAAERCRVTPQTVCK